VPVRPISGGFIEPSLQPVRNYEELDGAQGREVFFRAERFRAESLAPLKLEATVDWADSALVCGLVDVSQSGAALLWPADVPAAPDTLLSRLTITVDGVKAFSGAARVSSVRGERQNFVVGVSFAQSHLDIDEILQIQKIRTWTDGDPALGLGHPTWRAKTNERYRALVGEFHLYLQDASEHMARWEASLPWDVVHGELDTPARLALMDRLQQGFVPTVLGYFSEMDAAVRDVAADDVPALRAFAQRMLDDRMLRAPLLYRARRKPLGYPGDFECMNYMYSKPFQGESLFAKALHLASCMSTPARAVRARKDLIKERIRQVVAEGRGDRPVRIASIAAGPAQEVFEFISELKELSVPVEFVLFDQDKLALSFSQRRIAALVEAHWRGAVRVVFLHDSIKRLLHDPTMFGDLGPFDLIFSTGLFDYLRFSTAVTLCRNLYANTAPGGRAYVGNMDPSNPCRQVFEHLLEWDLIYRTQEQMLEFGVAALPHARLSTLPEGTGINPFLVLEKD